MKMKNKIFDYICKCIAWNHYVSLVPSTEIARHFNITLYRARKYIKELVTDGLLKSDIQVLYFPPYDKEDDWYPPRIYRGYTLTNIAFESDCFKQHYQDMEESYIKWARGDYDE